MCGYYLIYGTMCDVMDCRVPFRFIGHMFTGNDVTTMDLEAYLSAQEAEVEKRNQ
jgi:hypothetical protein